MNEEKYAIIDYLEIYYYDFISEGPKGKIRKVVSFRLIEESPSKVYNLAFGDWDESKNDIDYEANSNNDDMRKILSTVGEAVIEFTQQHPDIWVFIQGSTSSRTRLYQMGIGIFWQEIDPQFIVLGNVDGDWEPFRKGINYISFLIRHK
jgi:hypothetical protein